MPQVDNTIWFSIIFSLLKSSIVCYGFILVYLFFPFISRIKVIYNFFSKIRFIKKLLSAI